MHITKVKQTVEPLRPSTTLTPSTISSFMLWNIFNPFPETVVLDKTLESTLDSNQSILKEINPEYSLEGLMLKLQYFGHLMQRQPANSLKKILMLGKTGGRMIKRRQRMRWLDGIIKWMDMSLSKLQEIVKDRETWRATVYGVTKSRTLQSDWTTKHLLYSLYPK